jgi:hypothetical protein
VTGKIDLSSKAIEGAKSLMGALVRMKPKPHEEMKIRKKKKAKTSSKKRAASKPKNA